MPPIAPKPFRGFYLAARGSALGDRVWKFSETMFSQFKKTERLGAAALTGRVAGDGALDVTQHPHTTQMTTFALKGQTLTTERVVSAAAPASPFEHEALFARTLEVTKARGKTVLGVKSTTSYTPRGAAGKRFSIELHERKAFGLKLSYRRVIRRVIESGQEQQTVVRSKTTLTAGPLTLPVPSAKQK